MHSSEPSQLAGKVAVVTGGTVGIGKAVCLRLAQQGAYVVVVGRDQDRLNAVVSEIEHEGQGRVLACRGDVRSETDLEETTRAAVGQFGGIDVLIASAGILRARGSSLKTMEKMSLAEWDEVIDTNLKGVYLANKAVLPTMIQQRSGHIVNLSSTSGLKGHAFDTAYCASKFGVIGLTESLADEVRPYGIRVQVLLPGAIDTSMWDQNGPLRRPEFALPVGRVADLILAVLQMPEDATLAATVVEPMGRPARDGWLGAQHVDETTQTHGRPVGSIRG
ncbi:MAG: SDR family NAD(P)-dependent oxidoreductase [Planctomycetota bacterium]